MSSDFQFGEPEIVPSHMCIGIAGATGTGKTWSAMELMVGMVGNGNFGVLDTEQGRAIHYHEKKLGNKGFRFLHARFDPPYSPERYKAGIAAAVKQGVKGLIIDSGSHMWEGDGGMQDQVEKRANEFAQKYGGERDKYQFSAWRAPKEAAWDMIQFAKGCGIHVIICMRAKTKNKMEKVEKPKGGFKTEIVPIGYQPIIDTQLPFEMDFCATLDPDQAGVPTFTYKPLAEQFHGLFRPGQMLSKAHGKALVDWCNQGKSGAAEGSKPKADQRPEKVTITAPDGRFKEVAPDKAVDLIIASMKKCESQDDAWAYINLNAEIVSSLSQEERDRFDAASSAIVGQITSDQMAPA